MTQKYLRRIKKFLLAATISFFLNAVSVLFMPLCSTMAYTAGRRWLLLLNGSVFWLGLIMGFAFVFAANSDRKEYIRKHLDGDVSMKRRPVAITFFSNQPAKVADITMCLSFVLTVIILFTPAADKYITYVMLTFFLFSLNMHGILNGRSYKILTKLKARREEENE